MKVVIDATTLLLRSAGVKNYMHYWLSSLREANILGHDTVATYPPGLQVTDEIDHEHSSGSSASSYWRLKLVQFTNIRHNPLLGMFLTGADIFHASQHTANLPGRGIATATVFDMSCWTVPHTHTTGNIAATKRYADRILKRCAGLIAISEHTRNDAVEILGIPKSRIRVIYPGVPESFFGVTLEAASTARATYGISGPYFLFVGCIEPRKNVAGLMEAYQRLPEGLRRDVQLVVAGPLGWGSEALQKTLLGGGVKGVRYLGYVPEHDLPGLFRGALALTYPSYYEGFGFPPAQAMAAGIPVIASNRSCLPEIVGDAGLFPDPDSVEEMSIAMERLAKSATLAASLGEAGKVNAEKFHWSTCAAESLRFFRDMASHEP